MSLVEVKKNLEKNRVRTVGSCESKCENNIFGLYLLTVNYYRELKE